MKCGNLLHSIPDQRHAYVWVTFLCTYLYRILHNERERGKTLILSVLLCVDDWEQSAIFLLYFNRETCCKIKVLIYILSWVAVWVVIIKWLSQNIQTLDHDWAKKNWLLFFLFLAHLKWRSKSAFLITCCLSSLCPSWFWLKFFNILFCF